MRRGLPEPLGEVVSLLQGPEEPGGVLQPIQVVGGMAGQLLGLADRRRDDQPTQQPQEPDACQQDDRHRPATGQAPTLQPADLGVQAHGVLAQRDPREAVVEIRVCHRRWVLPSDRVVQEIERRDDEQAQAAGDQEHILGKSHNEPVTASQSG